MIKNNNYFACFIFLQFYLTSLREKNILPNLNNSQEPELGFFLAPWSWSRSRKIPGAGAAWKKNQEPELLKDNSGAGAAKKLAGSPAL